MGPEGTAFALLLLGHVLGDFTLQTDEMATNKHRLGPLLAHGGVVISVHLVVLVPLLSSKTVLVVMSVGVAHVLVDAVTARLRHHVGPSTRLFLGDQTVHLLVLLGGWSMLGAPTLTNSPVVSALGGISSLPWSEITAGAVYTSAFVFAHHGGNAIVQRVLPDDGPESKENDLEAGSLIGSLERWLVLALGLAGLWESVALVVAAKSVARFEELKERAFAEYFLVGTLASVLVAIGLVIVVSVLV
ncbi:MAG: DUF3307 domain-containing protein [Haloarculaceae archaeon]